MKGTVGILGVFVGAFALSGCSENQCPAEQPSLDACNSGFYVRFGGEEQTNDLRPFPNPLRTSIQPFKSGTTGYSPDYPGDFGRLLNTMDGFGPYAPIMVQFNDVIDPVFLPQLPEQSLDPESPVFLVDLEAIRAVPSSSFASVVRPVTAWYNGTQAGVPVNTMSVAPYVPLEPKHEYAVVVTDRMRTWLDPLHSNSACIGPSSRYNCIKSTSKVDPALENMRLGQEELFAWLDSQGLSRGEVSIALHFTTQSIEDELIDIKEQLDTFPAPKGRIDPNRVFTDVADVNGKLKQNVKDYFQELFPPEVQIDVDFDDYDFGAMGTIAFGFFPSRDYRHPEFDLFITDGVTGHVHEQGINDLEFIVILPKYDPANGVVPPYKTVVFQHALTVCKETAAVIANEFNKRGMAMIGLDVVNHGSRSEEALAGGPRQCQIEALDFLQLDNPLAGREGFRQTVVDQFQLVQMVQEMPLDLDGDGNRDIKTDRLGYVSQSLGSIIGGTFVALEPEIGAAVLNVGGGGLYAVALSFFGSEGGGGGGPEAFETLPTLLLDFMLIVQNVLDRADPINYAHHVVQDPFVISGIASSPKNVLLQEAVGDDTVGNYSTDSLTREMGGEIAGPSVFRAVPGLSVRQAPFGGNLANGKATIAMTQFSPAEHSFLLTLDDPGAFCRGQVQAAEFVNSYMLSPEKVATVIDAYTAPEAAWCPP